MKKLETLCAVVSTFPSIEDSKRTDPWPEGSVTVEDYDQGLPNQADVTAVWLEASIVRQSAAIEALGLACVVEEDVCERHDAVGRVSMLLNIIAEGRSKLTCS
jgi:hypothetical protein